MYLDIELILLWIAFITICNIIPGPDFLFITANSIRNYRQGWLAACGLQTGVLCWSIASSATILLVQQGVAVGIDSTVASAGIGTYVINFLGLIGAIYITRLAWQISTGAYRNLQQLQQGSQQQHNDSTSNSEIAQLTPSQVSNSSDQHNSNFLASLQQAQDTQLGQEQPSCWTIYRQGLFCNLSNPKCFMFMFLVLPQFVSTKVTASILEQLVVLCSVNLLDGFVVWFSLALLVHKVVSYFKSNRFVVLFELGAGLLLLIIAISMLISVLWELFQLFYTA